MTLSAELKPTSLRMSDVIDFTYEKQCALPIRNPSAMKFKCHIAQGFWFNKWSWNEFVRKYKSNFASQLVYVILTLRRLVIGSIWQKPLELLMAISTLGNPSA